MIKHSYSFFFFFFSILGKESWILTYMFSPFPHIIFYILTLTFNMTIAFLLNMETEPCNHVSLDIGKIEENVFEGSE